MCARPTSTATSLTTTPPSLTPSLCACGRRCSSSSGSASNRALPGSGALTTTRSVDTRARALCVPRVSCVCRACWVCVCVVCVGECRLCFIISSSRKTRVRFLMFWLLRCLRFPLPPLPSTLVLPLAPVHVFFWFFHRCRNWSHSGQNSMGE